MELSPQEFASQLKKPEGKAGLSIGEFMNKGNKDICLNSYKILNPKPNSLIAEIGMGNGFFIKDLLSLTDGLSYVGIDFSQTMIDEALSLNQSLVEVGKVSFVNASLESIPLEDNSVDYVTTTNTVYFWPHLEENAKEIKRVLKPGGKLLIGYRSKEFMDKLEVAKFGFNKYTEVEVESALKEAGFEKIKTETIEEPVLEITGQKLEMCGFYCTAIKK